MNENDTDSDADGVTWKPVDAQGNEFSNTGYCPYWQCQTTVAFIGSMGYDGDSIVDVRYECENCGRSQEWANNAKGHAPDAPSLADRHGLSR